MGTNAAPLSLPAQGAGPQGHAPSGRCRGAGRAAAVLLVRCTYPSPRLGSRLSCKCDPRPSCAWLELGIWAKVSERGRFTQGRQACSFKDHRGAQRVEMGAAVRCSRAEKTERPLADARPGRDPRRQAELCSSLSYQIGFVVYWVISGLRRGLEPGRGALKAWRGLSPELPPGGIWNPSLTPGQKGAAGSRAPGYIEAPNVALHLA